MRRLNDVTPNEWDKVSVPVKAEQEWDYNVNDLVYYNKLKDKLGRHEAEKYLERLKSILYADW